MLAGAVSSLRDGVYDVGGICSRNILSLRDIWEWEECRCSLIAMTSVLCAASSLAEPVGVGIGPGLGNGGDGHCLKSLHEPVELGMRVFKIIPITKITRITVQTFSTRAVGPRSLPRDSMLRVGSR
jgi:hypothetical protein